MVTALMIKPKEHPTITHLVDSAKYLDLAVSVGTDYTLTATALKIEDNIVAIHSYEGTLMMARPNRKIGAKIIAGTFYVVRVHNGKLHSLTDKDIARFTWRFWEPEIHTDDGVFESWYP